jgi:hypothetical protein
MADYTDFAIIFEGNQRAYGTYEVTEIKESGKNKGKAATITKPVTIELYQKHVSGEQSLGITPINDDDRCRFGAIDIDEYPCDLQTILKRIVEMGMPLIPCETKSNGVHLYLFTSEFVPAKLMQEKLQIMASQLGYGNSEIFPKQIKLLKERGDVGSWINLPYFGKTRFAYRKDGKQLDFEEFIRSVKTNWLDYKHLNVWEPRLNTGPNEDDLMLFKDGPECLNLIFKRGIDEGERNTVMFETAKYYLKKHPELRSDPTKLVAKLVEVNRANFPKRMELREIQGVAKSATTKEYQYSCREQPMCNHCNVVLCRQREFGIGTGNSMPRIRSLECLKSEPVIWWMEIDGGGDQEHTRLELTTEELHNPVLWQKRCIEVLMIAPPVLKRDQWTEILNELLRNAQIIEVPRDGTSTGQLGIYLEDYLTSDKHQANEPHDLSREKTSKVWTDEKYHHFKLNGFMEYLHRMNFKDFKRNQITAKLKNNFKCKSVIIAGNHSTSIRVWRKKLIHVNNHPLTVPSSEEKVPY